VEVASVSGRLALLRNSNFRLIFIGQAVSSLGSSMVPVALAFGILADGGKAIDLAYVFGAQEVAGLGLYLFGGVAADHFPRRLVMVSADTVRAASQIALGLLLIGGHPPVVDLCACTAVQGVAGGFFTPAAHGLIPSVVEPEALYQANSLRQIGSSSASIVGPALAGVLVVTVGGGLAIVLNGVSFAINALMLTLIRVGSPPREDRASRPSVLRDLHTGWRAFRALRWYVNLVSAYFFGCVCVGIFRVDGPVVADRYLGGAGAWAAMWSVGAVGSVIGGLGLMHLNPRHPLRIGEFFNMIWAAFPIAVALTLPLVAICLISPIALLSGLLADTLLFGTVQRVVPQDVLSRVISYDYFLSFLGIPLGMLAGGLLAPVIGPRTTVLLAGIAIAAIALSTACRPIIWRFTVPDSVPGTSRSD
jgi:MFS family permease